MKKFKSSDFPLGSYFYLFKKVDIQVNPSSRVKGCKRYNKDFAFIKLQVTGHLDDYIIQCSEDDSFSGWSTTNNDSNCFIFPESYFIKIRNEIETTPSLLKMSIILEHLSEYSLIGLTKYKLTNSYTTKLKYHQIN